jgi:mannose-6-phosphate isomerase
LKDMENKLYRLKNRIKHYEWGSRELLPQFLNIENSKKIPWAEMWMGTHKLSPSQTEVDGSLINLTELSGELPFLFKLLAVEKPLSIQAHPNKAQAEEGFKREESLGLSIKNPTRNYRDTNHKPEILCALSPFTMMAGFREPDRIRASLEEFLLTAPPLKEIISPLLRALASDSLSSFFRILYGLSGIEREYLSTFICEKDDVQGGVITQAQWNLMKDFASQYPGDPAIISPLFLNLFTLRPGQAVFIPSGVLHAYISGFGVELMASSDNVLRGGLTPKHVDTGELMNILHFVPFIPQIIAPSSSVRWFCYHTPCGDFLLSMMRGEGEEKAFGEKGPAICIVTEGELRAGNEIFKKGESFFLPRTDSACMFSGNYFLYAASSGG